MKLIKKTPVPNFNKIKQDLEKKVGKDSRSKLVRSKMFDKLLSEYNISEKNPNLVLFLGACTITYPLLLLYEYMPNSSLDVYYSKKYYEKNKLWKPKKYLAYIWIYELTQAIYFLHHCYYPIMHRDLKLSNILVTNNNKIKK